jgi:hypothetical protein
VIGVECFSADREATPRPARRSVEGIVLVTRDETLAPYDVRTILV